MANKFGMQGMPKGGNALVSKIKGGNLQQVGDILGFPAKVIVVRSDQIVKAPSWARYARTSATGKGGVGYVSGATGRAGGGGGAGFSGTNIEKIAPGASIVCSFVAGASIADGIGYRCVAAPGRTATSSAGTGALGGVGTGGAVNFSGGDGGTSTANGYPAAGGGAASRGGNGKNGSNGTNTGANLGGLGGDAIEWFSQGAPGGTTASGLGPVDGSPIQTVGAATIRIFGVQANTADGFDGGGGAAGKSQVDQVPRVPGDGFIIIEFW